MPVLLRMMTFFILTIISFVSCNRPADAVVSPPGYDLTNPEKFLMPSGLLEISGIAFYQGNSDTVYAIQDEDGKLFRMAWKERKQKHTKFSKGGDYEDVAILNENVIILKSNGELYIFPFSESKYGEALNVREIKHLLPDGEYEGIYGDETSGNIYVLCKNCPADNSKIAVTGYILNMSDTLKQTGSFTIDVSEIKAIAGKVTRGFRPSGLAQNPLTKEWFIISAVNKLLVIADSDWKVNSVYHLKGKMFNQPEGIAFDKAGNLYISNEGDDLSDGNILEFDRK